MNCLVIINTMQEKKMFFLALSPTSLRPVHNKLFGDLLCEYYYFMKLIIIVCIFSCIIKLMRTYNV
jgi:hypothetical protein